VERTGQGGGINGAAEVERLLAKANRLPDGNIPWSTLTRLLSSEEFRNSAEFRTAGRQFRLIHDHGAVADARKVGMLAAPLMPTKLIRPTAEARDIEGTGSGHSTQ